MQKDKNHPENIALTNEIKQVPSTKLDSLVSQISAEETEKIDCTTCGKCCQVLQPPFTTADQIKLDQEKISYKSLLVLDSSNQQFYLKESPCHFLCDKKCTIYNSRPSACADYPHLHQPHFKYRFKSVMTQYEICPIVYHTVERLKIALGVC